MQPVIILENHTKKEILIIRVRVRRMYGVRMSMHLGSSYASLMGNKASSRIGRNYVQDEVWGKEKKMKNKRKLPAYPLGSGV